MPNSISRLAHAVHEENERAKASHGKSQPLDFAPERNFPIGFKADDMKITLSDVQANRHQDGSAFLTCSKIPGLPFKQYIEYVWIVARIREYWVGTNSWVEASRR